MKANIYIERDGKWEGPFTRDQLRDFVGRGLLTHKSLCRVDRDGKMEIHEVEYFIGGFGVTVSAPPKEDSPAHQNHAQPSAGPSVTPLGLFATLLIITGVVGLVYFVGFFDKSVAADSGWRVNNFGLMQDRMIGIILCVLSLVIGVLMTLFGRRK